MTTALPPLLPLPDRRRDPDPAPVVPAIVADPAPTTVRIDRITALALLLIAVVTGGMLVAGLSWEDALLPGLAVLVAVYGAVFCLRAVTVTGFLAGAAGAALVLTGLASLVVALAVAGALAAVCGVAPAWRRVEAWQSGRTALAGAGPSQAARLWRADRVAAAFLVLSFPPVMAAFAEFFIAWSTSR